MGVKSQTRTILVASKKPMHVVCISVTVWHQFLLYGLVGSSILDLMVEEVMIIQSGEPIYDLFDRNFECVCISTLK